MQRNWLSNQVAVITGLLSLFSIRSLNPVVNGGFSTVKGLRRNEVTK